MAADSDNSLDNTTSATISLLEARLLRIEHLLYGRHASRHPPSQHDSASQKLRELEARFSAMVSQIRVYGELLRIYRFNPDLYHAPGPSGPPSLSLEAIRSIVLASASAFPTALSALTAIQDCPVPDPSESASLVGLMGRMNAIETTQIAQAADMAELRRRSEAAMLSWYESGVLATSRSLADVEKKFQIVERRTRRSEVALDSEKQI